MVGGTGRRRERRATTRACPAELALRGGGGRRAPSPPLRDGRHGRARLSGRAGRCNANAPISWDIKPSSSSAPYERTHPA